MTLDDTWVLKSTHVHVAFYPFNAATNIYTTAAIIYRVNRDASKGSGHTFKRRLCRDLAETGSLIVYILSNFCRRSRQPFHGWNRLQSRSHPCWPELCNAGGSQLDSQTTDRRRLLSGRHHHHPSSSTQEQTITTLGDAEKGVLSITSAPGVD
ncbi:hypothetical protein JOM56_005306 [Amanita muscaria]